jgi:hypothetical protein
MSSQPGGGFFFFSGALSVLSLWKEKLLLVVIPKRHAGVNLRNDVYEEAD